MYHSSSREIILRSLKQKELLQPVEYLSLAAELLEIDKQPELPKIDSKVESDRQTSQGHSGTVKKTKKNKMTRKAPNKIQNNTKERKDYKMPIIDPSEPNYMLMSYMLKTLPGNMKKTNEYLGYCLIHLRARKQHKRKNLDQKLISKCRRDWSLLLHEASQRKTSTEYKADNLVLIEKAPLSASAIDILHPEPKTGKAKKYCCFPECRNTDRSHKLHRVPKKVENKNYCDKRELYRYRGRKLFQRTCWKRLGIPDTDKRKDLRFCNAHRTETYEESIKVRVGKKRTKKLHLPMNLAYPWVRVSRLPKSPYLVEQAMTASWLS